MPVRSCLLLALLLPCLAQANDSVAGVSAGGIVLRKTDALAMKKEVLSISQTLIEVDYEFLNETNVDVSESVAFPLPLYPAVSNDYVDSYYGQPKGFVLAVDGKPVAYSTRIDAMIDGRNVTEALRQAGLSDQQIAYNPTFYQTPVRPLTKEQNTLLAKLGLAGEHGKPGAPLWSVQVNYVWQQSFPAGKIVKVHHAYRPFNDGGFSEVMLPPDFAKDYCADQEFVHAWERTVKKKKLEFLTAETVGYILKSGNNWKNGIEDFTLKLIKPNPGELVSLCFPGKFTKVNPTTYEVHLSNFHPKQDLKIYFSNFDRANVELDRQGIMPTIKPSQEK